MKRASFLLGLVFFTLNTAYAADTAVSMATMLLSQPISARTVAIADAFTGDDLIFNEEYLVGHTWFPMQRGGENLVIGIHLIVYHFSFPIRLKGGRITSRKQVEEWSRYASGWLLDQRSRQHVTL